MTKKIIKKFLKWTGITLFVLIALLILIPILFKDQIKELVLKEVNKNLTADLSIGDFDLTFLSTFPNMTVELYDSKLVGRDKFKGVELANIGEIQAHVGFWSVIAGDQVEIDEIHIVNPTFDVRVMKDGLANYDIVKPDSAKTKEEIEEPSSFKLSLKEYSISNAKVKYDDRSMNIYMEMDSLRHSGKGDLTSDKINFETATEVDKVSYRMDGVSYLTEVRTDATVNLLMEFNDNSSKYTLKENSIKLNEITFSLNGFYEMLEGHDNIDLKLDASKAKFKEFLSLIPAFYHSGYESMVASGSMKMDGFVKGKLDETNYPAWDFNLLVKNGSVNYPSLPGKITNIALDAGSKFKGGENLDAMIIQVPSFHADLGKNSLDANLTLKNSMTDPQIKSGLKADADLSTLKNYIPLEKGESYSGLLKSDVRIEGRMSDLENEDYENFKAEGDINVNGMHYKSASLNDGMDIETMALNFSPQNLKLTTLNAKLGNSDIQMVGNIGNYLPYFLRGETLSGDFTLNSKNFDLDEFMGDAPEVSEGAPETSLEDEVYLVPGNLDLSMTSSIDNVRYNAMDFKEVEGVVRVKDEVAKLERMSFKSMGGTIGLSGSYDTRDVTDPKIDFGYNLKEIDINQLTTNFVTIEKLAPITKFAQGKISSEMTMNSSLDNSMTPVLSSLSSLGTLRSNKIMIKDFGVLKKIENHLKVKKFSNQTLKNFYAKFKVTNGELHVDPFNVKLGKYSTDVSGFTTLDKKMDYNFKINIPKEEIPKEVLDAAEKGMKKLDALIPDLKLASLPDIIPVNVRAIGDVKNPKITSDFKEQVMKATGNLAEDIINNVIETAKDSIESIVNEQVENINAEKEKQKAQILANAQKKADQAKAAAKKAADATRLEGDKQADALIKEAGSNPIKKKLAEKAAEKLREEAEVKAKKIESEGDKKADAIMAEARKKADAI